MRPRDRKKNGNNGVKKEKCTDCRGSGQALEGGPYVTGIKLIKKCQKCNGDGFKIVKLV
jgi:DnaJ-class molecular chaperone